MKSSKQFATERGTWHNVANMMHTTVQVIGVESPMENGVRFVTLTMFHQRSTLKYAAKLRMTKQEARLLAERLLRAADDTPGSYISDEF